MELAELEVGQVRPRDVGEHRSGADRAARVRRPLPQRRPAPGRQDRGPGCDRPGVREHPGAALTIAPEGDDGGALQHLEPGGGLRDCGQARGQRAAGGATAGVDDPSRRVASLEAELQLAARSDVELDAPAAQFVDGGRGLAGEDLDRGRAAEATARVEGVVGVALPASRRPPARRRARPGPSSWSSRPAACARRGSRCAPASAARIATYRPAAPPPTTTTSHSVGGVGCTSGRRYGSPLALYLAHPSSLQHDTGPHPENAGRLRAIEAALEARDWLGLDRVEAPAADRAQLERVHSTEQSTGSSASAPPAAA